jgi:hypothetical protein
MSSVPFAVDPSQLKLVKPITAPFAVDPDKIQLIQSGQVTPSPLSKFAGEYVSKMNPLPIGNAIVQAVANPVATTREYAAQTGKILDDAEEAWKSGDYVSAARHAFNYFLNGIPGLGASLEEAGNKMQSGDVAGALADTSALGTQIALGTKLPAIAEGTARGVQATAAAAKAAAPGVGAGAAMLAGGEMLGKIPGMEWPARLGMGYPGVRQIMAGGAKGAAAFRQALMDSAPTSSQVPVIPTGDTTAAVPLPVRPVPSYGPQGVPLTEALGAELDAAAPPTPPELDPSLLDGISGSQAGKPYAKLDPVGQAQVRQIAKNLTQGMADDAATPPTPAAPPTQAPSPVQAQPTAAPPAAPGIPLVDQLRAELDASIAARNQPQPVPAQTQVPGSAAESEPVAAPGAEAVPPSAPAPATIYPQIGLTQPGYEDTLGPGLQVFRVPITAVDQTENPYALGKGPDIASYAARIRAGEQPPPLFGKADPATGRVTISDGNRRLEALRQTGASAVDVATAVPKSFQATAVVAPTPQEPGVLARGQSAATPEEWGLIETPPASQVPSIQTPAQVGRPAAAGPTPRTLAQTEAAMAQVNNPPAVEPPTSLYNAAGERVSPGLRGQQIKWMNAANKADRFAQAINAEEMTPEDLSKLSGNERQVLTNGLIARDQLRSPDQQLLKPDETAPDESWPLIISRLRYMQKQGTAPAAAPSPPTMGPLANNPKAYAIAKQLFEEMQKGK